MPRSRSGAVTANGHSITRLPGAYVYVLREGCAEALYDGSLALTDVSAEEVAADERDYRERVAELVERRRRAGEPVNARSSDLPPDLQSPFENWPPGGQRCFVVTPDDRIVLRPNTFTAGGFTHGSQ